MLQISIKFKKLPIEMDGVHCCLREMDGNGREAYMEHVRERFKGVDVEALKQGKVTSNFSMKGLNALLLSLCLFHIDGEGLLNPFTIEEIEAFPGTVIEVLVNEAKKLNGIEVEEGPEAPKKS